MVYFELAVKIGFIALITFTVCSVLNFKQAGVYMYATRMFRCLMAVAILAATILTTVAKIVALIAKAVGKDDQIDFASGIGGVYNHLTGQSEKPRGQLGVYDEDLNDYV